jgi:hypothetical protein
MRPSEAHPQAAGDLANPWRYRRLLRRAERFFRLMPWLWALGIIGCLLVSLLRLDDRALALVCALTIYPALVGWLGLTGIGILWTSLLTRSRRGRGKSFTAIWLAVAVVFLVGALVLLSGLLLGLGGVRANA